MNKLRLIISWLFLIFVVSLTFPRLSFAVVRTWDGEGSTNNWSEGANWSANTAPGSSDVATFDGTSTKDATVDASFTGSVQGVDINTGYSGIITLSRSITIGSSGYDQNAGQFNGGSQTIDLNGVFNLTGGTFSATTGTFTAATTFTVNGGTFTHNSGTVTFDGTSTNTITCGATTFNAVLISKSSSGNALSINTGCTLPISGTNPSSTGSITNAGTINVTGNWTLSGSYTSSGGTLAMTGTSLTIAVSLTLTSGTFPAGLTTLTVGRSLNNSGSLLPNGLDVTLDSGGVGPDVITCGTVTFNSVTISKSISSRDVQISSGCVIPIAGTNPSSTGTITNAGTINVTGNWTLDGGYTSSGGTLNTTGTSFTITQNMTLTTGTFPSNVTTLSVGRSLNNTGSLLPDGINVTLNLGGSAGDTITCGTVNLGSVTISKDIDTRSLSISSDCILPLAGTNPSSTATITNAGTINVTGTWTLNGSYISSGGTLSVSGTSVTITKDLTLSSGTFASGISNLNVGFDLNNSGNILPNNLALSLYNGVGTVDDHDVNCGNATFASITLNKILDGHEVSLTSDCTTANFTSTIGALDNPDSSRTLYITGNFSQTNNVTQGGSNLTIEFSGSGTQTISKTTGSVASIFKVNKTGGSVALNTPFAITSQTCDVVEGVFDLNGNSFECGSTFTVQDGGTLRLIGYEISTAPTLNTGSIVTYKGDGDSAADNFLPKDWSHKHLTVNFTDSNDTLDAPTNNSLTTSEVGYWKMDENTGTTVEDSSANNNTATRTNAVFSTTSLPSLSVSNVSNIDFDGSGDYLDMGNDLSIAQNQSVVSVFAWVRKDSNSGVDQIFGLSQGDNTGTTRIGLLTSGDEVQCVASAGDSEGEHTITTTATNLVVGGWYPLACVINYATDSMTIYVNG
jgi:hypothetical protein